MLLKEHVELPDTMTDLVIYLPLRGIVECDCKFNLRWKHKRDYFETLRDIEKGLDESRELIRTSFGNV